MEKDLYTSYSRHLTPHSTSRWRRSAKAAPQCPRSLPAPFVCWRPPSGWARRICASAPGGTTWRAAANEEKPHPWVWKQSGEGTIWWRQAILLISIANKKLATQAWRRWRWYTHPSITRPRRLHRWCMPWNTSAKRGSYSVPSLSYSRHQLQIPRSCRLACKQTWKSR